MSGPYDPPPYPGGPTPPTQPAVADSLWFKALDKLVTVAMLIGALAAYERNFGPRPAELAPDRVTAAAQAYLAMQPASFEAVSKQVRDGEVNVDTLDEALGKARIGPAQELGDAIRSSPSLADALDVAAQAIRKGMK